MATSDRRSSTGKRTQVASGSGNNGWGTPPTSSTGQTGLVENKWIEYIDTNYPHRHSKAVFLPPRYLRKVSHKSVDYCGEKVRAYATPQKPSSATGGSRKPRKNSGNGNHSSPLQVAGKVYVPNPESLEDCCVQLSDIQDKNAMEWVLRHLYRFADSHKRVMVVISDLKFMKYLSVRSGAECKKYPRTIDQYGEFDLIIVDRTNGIIVGEVKSVTRAAGMSDDQYLQCVATKAGKAVDQLNKASRNLQHMVSDIASHATGGCQPGAITVSKTLIMPNVTRDELRRALEQDKAVSQKLQDCLDEQDLPSALNKCLLKDNLTDCDAHHDVNDSVASELIRWLNIISAPCLAMNDNIYDMLFARFCGPVTETEIATVTKPHMAIKTMGDFVGETGLRLSLLALYRSQLELLHNDDPLVFIYGPPGTGKTVVLTLKAREWLLRGLHVQVHVVSTQYKGRAVAMLIQRQLQMSSDPSGLRNQGRVFDHHYDFSENHEDANKAAEELAALAVDGELYVIMDEVDNRYRDCFKEVCCKLRDRVPSLFLWAAGLKNDNIPDWLRVHEMRSMLRCPPVIHNEINLSENIVVDSVSYADDHVSHTHGPDIKWLTHRGIPGHTEGEPKNCAECGRMIARELKNLEVGHAATNVSLTYRDVLITYSNPDEDDSPEAAAQDKELGLVEGLRSCGVGVIVLKHHAKEQVYRDVALAVHNKVVVSNWQAISGLERRVVVGLGDLTSMDRLFIISRCTSQLFWIDHKVAPTAGWF